MMVLPKGQKQYDSFYNFYGRVHQIRYPAMANFTFGVLKGT